MKRLVPILLLAALTLSAQRARLVPGAPPLPRVSEANRFGNILYPGGLPSANQGHIGRLGATVNGYYPQPAGRPQVGPPGRVRTVVVPYAYPVYYAPDPYAYAYAQQQQASPSITVVVPQQPAPSVVINHNYSPDTANPVLRDYTNERLPETGSGVKVYEGPKSEGTRESAAETPRTAPSRAGRAASDKATIYLVAMKDGTIRQAIGYWTKGDSFGYVTPQGAIHNIELAQLDRNLSVQLNGERNLEFELDLP